MRKNKIFQYGLGFLVLLGGLSGTSSCKRKSFAGPELSSAQEGFAFTSAFQANKPLLSFNDVDPTIGFSASFNQKVSWEVVVHGLASGAKRKYTGTGDAFTADQIVFDGRANGVPFFRSDEYLRAELLILGLNDTTVVDSIETINGYSYHRQVRHGVKHIVVDDFEQSSGSKYAPVSLAVATDAADNGIEFIADTNNLTQGVRGYKMLGRDVNNNGWCGGMNSENLVDFYLVQNPTQLLIDSGVKPEELYFNMYVYGTGKANSTVEFKVYEFDHKSLYVAAEDTTYIINNRADMLKAISDGGGPPLAREPYDQSVNDGWIYDQVITWTGWKLVSVPYSQFRAANDLLSGGNGDRVKESWRICGMAVSLLSYPTTGNLVETYIDYLTITTGGKFQQ